ncbi:unnamed protein product [Kuraishia capsulata CBS 1993]|uniref:PI31 proteasome regulator C-terminal domain-containing protein n=1 Tax=Kuraishia capsulata CBS 1993 TaxID=1382522 RepID=W6MNU4_9ASCO|nr:uncharacterized protein KUCA_T00002706001 [Kuraishia capsulata CBS 1993]CDK26732.1 unnamed protein product [Kuraishia capsulata CBS 1993]
MALIIAITERWLSERFQTETTTETSPTSILLQSAAGISGQIFSLAAKNAFVVVLSLKGYIDSLVVDLSSYAADGSVTLSDLESSGDLAELLKTYDFRFKPLISIPEPRDIPSESLQNQSTLEQNALSLPKLNPQNKPQATQGTQNTQDPQKPPGFEDEYQMTQPQSTTPISAPSHFGDSDLNPSGLGPNPQMKAYLDPLNRGIGGGMHPTADDPLFQGPGLRYGAGSLRPPGARFDDPLFGGGDFDMVGQGLPGSMGLGQNKFRGGGGSGGFGGGPGGFGGGSGFGSGSGSGSGFGSGSGGFGFL